jgi:hypothetical protein
MGNPAFFTNLSKVLGERGGKFFLAVFFLF